MEVVNVGLAEAIGVPAADEPGNPARLLCTQRGYVKEGIYFGPDLPLLGLVSKEAGYCFSGTTDAIQDAYWDAFELELRRSNVAMLYAFHNELYEDIETRSIYVVDLDRFPVWNGKNIEGYREGDGFLIDESMIQRAYLPEKQRLRDRLAKAFRRSD